MQQAGVPTGLVEGTGVLHREPHGRHVPACGHGWRRGAINATTDAEVIVQRVLPEVFASQGIYSIAGAAL